MVPALVDDCAKFYCNESRHETRTPGFIHSQSSVGRCHLPDRVPALAGAFLLFLPFLVTGEVFGMRKRVSAERLERVPAQSGGSPEAARLRAVAGRSTDRFIFDRRKDISKLFGCNTRNVQYRCQRCMARFARFAAYRVCRAGAADGRA